MVFFSFNSVFLVFFFRRSALPQAFTCVSLKARLFFCFVLLDFLNLSLYSLTYLFALFYSVTNSLSVCLSVCLSLSLSRCFSVCLNISLHLSVYLFIYLFINLFIYLHPLPKNVLTNDQANFLDSCFFFNCFFF